jgi:hypothetical protein
VPFSRAFFALAPRLILQPMSQESKPFPPDRVHPDPVAYDKEVPRHPSHNRKEIRIFVVIVLISVTAWFGLAQFPQTEMLALYVLAFGAISTLLASWIFRSVRCPHCRRAMTCLYEKTIAGREWEVFQCPSCRDQWRVEKPVNPYL